MGSNPTCRSTMKKSTNEDRSRWPRNQFPNWNRFMDWCDKEIDKGLIDIKFFRAKKANDLELAAREIMEMIEAPKVPDLELL